MHVKDSPTPFVKLAPGLFRHSLAPLSSILCASIFTSFVTEEICIRKLRLGVGACLCPASHLGVVSGVVLRDSRKGVGAAFPKLAMLYPQRRGVSRTVQESVGATALFICLLKVNFQGEPVIFFFLEREL